MLMQLDRDHVLALHQQAGIDREGEEDCLFDGGLGQGVEVNLAFGHAAARHLLPVEINHGSVVPLHFDGQLIELQGIVDVEGVAEVGGDVLIGGVGPVSDHGGLIAVAIAELRRAGSPTTVVEACCGPGRALIGAVVEILPGGTFLDQCKGVSDAVL